MAAFCRAPRHLSNLARPLPVPYPSGLPSPHKGMGTYTIFDLAAHHPTTTKLFKASIIPFPSGSVRYLYLTHPLHFPHPSLTCLASLGLIKGPGQTLYLI